MAVVVYRLALIESDTSNMGSIPFPKPKFICCQYLYSMHSTCVKLKKSRVVCVCVLECAYDSLSLSLLNCTFNAFMIDYHMHTHLYISSVKHEHCA